MRLSPLYLTFLFKLCLLGLASFIGAFCFGPFGDFILKGENVRPKQTSGSKMGRGKLCVNIGREYQNGGKFDLGGVWMMVSIQASVSSSNFVNFYKFMLAFLVLS
jgi:hypothetical protein